MFFRGPATKIQDISVVVLARDSEEFLAILLESLNSSFTEIIVGVDKGSPEGTHRVAQEYASKTIIIDNQYGTLEAAIEQTASHCSNDWVLWLDDGELISSQLVEFIRHFLPSLTVNAVGLHRKWCRVNLSTSNLEFAVHPTYGFDWQWRLFRKSKVTFNKNVNMPGIDFGTDSRAPLDAFILQLDWVYRGLKSRRDKLARYDAIRKRNCLGQYYLHEQLSTSPLLFVPLYVPDLDDLEKRLIPFQQKTNSHTTSFLTPDSDDLKVSLKSTVEKLSVQTLQRVQLPITVSNHSPHALFSSHPYGVFVSYHWQKTENGEYAVWDGLRTELPHPIFPNETTDVSVNIMAPRDPGAYNLILTLVREGHYWFEQKNPALSSNIPAQVAVATPSKEPLLRNLNLLSFEIGPACQLTNLHKECPINLPERHPNPSFGHLTPSLIARSIDQAQEMGFQGWAAFHYYNEPLLYMKQILEVMDLTRYDKFLLWTNGLLLAEHHSILDRFHTIHVTDYQLPDNPDFQKLMAEHPTVNWIIRNINLDDRIEISEPIRETVSCTRPEYLELPIDYYGNIHLCCYDWRGDTQIGNIIDRELPEIIHSSTFQSVLVALKGGADPPSICKSCRHPTQATSVAWQSRANLKTLKPTEA